MPAQGPAQPKAEVNFLRLSRACHQFTKGETSGNDLEADMIWRRIEAYSRRMREFLEEMRRGDRPPPPERIAEYERQLAAAVSEAETARRKWEEQNAPTKKTPKLTTATAPTQAASTSKPLPQSQPTLSDSSSIMTGTADRRAQLLGLASGAGVRHRGRGRGNRGALHAEEVLREERMAQARMEEQLSAMTRHLKGNVQAIHATLVQDNARLGVLDSDLSANTNNLSKVNVKVDEQRAANRRTTCFQCFAVLFVTLFFFGMFFFMRLFGKAAVIIHAEAPELTPFGGPVPEGGVALGMATRTKHARVFFTLDGSDPRAKGAAEFDAKKKVYVGTMTQAEAAASGGKKSCEVEVKAVAKGKGMQDSAVVSAKFAACAVEEEENRKEEARRKEEEEARKRREEKEEEEKRRRAEEEKQRKVAEEERRKEEEEANRKQEAETKKAEEEQSKKREEDKARAAEEEQARRAREDGDDQHHHQHHHHQEQRARGEGEGERGARETEEAGGGRKTPSVKEAQAG